MAQLIEGKVVAEKIFGQLKQRIQELHATRGLIPGIAVVIVGNDPASEVYVRGKVRKAQEIGVYSEKHEMPSDAKLADVLAKVVHLNRDPKVHGILVQSPLPRHLDERALIEAIGPEKDVDCFHPYNVGRLLIGDESGFVPCTPQGVMELIKHYGIPTVGKHAVVIGRSNIVGKPMAVLLSRKAKNADCTVTICHSRTSNLKELCLQADILVTAMGKAKFVGADMVKDGAVVIDVGISRVADPATRSGERLVGDVDFAAVAPKCSFITPVPGGVGPMTIAMLMRNTVAACCMQNEVEIGL
jgi:methylenetetrahydrofolate dehydrogenase (NADP+)/methenyltetrahydrofolate cyclohydrolase